MLEIVLVFTLGLLPSLFSWWVLQKAEQRVQEEFGFASSFRAGQSSELPPEHQYVNGLGLVIGDHSCQFNARSPYLRCAVNPSGPCQHCSSYQPAEFQS